MRKRVPVAVTWGEQPRSVRILDQTLLPSEERMLELTSLDEVAEAIRLLRVRGAPAIGIAAAMGAVVALEGYVTERPEASRLELEGEWNRIRSVLVGTRPTGRNLARALARLHERVVTQPWEHPRDLMLRLRAEATAVLEEDREQCIRIGETGQSVLPHTGTVGVLTHCNTGALATGGIGTALAVVYTAHRAGRTVRVFADETRPLLQGARLTAWELTRAGVDVTVLTDSMAGAKLASGDVNLVLVGADAIAANGDTANKIGTYGLAALAHHHGIPFYVAAPHTTFEASYGSGSDVPIEERDPNEVRRLPNGGCLPDSIAVWNPAFDVTPAHLITAFITDQGVLRPPYRATLRSLNARHR